ncbi:MAG TPA: helix-turn-helix transcriptional regulator [Thermoanaerobaculia bacterium]|jgi:transcriptional regulator with XRE-family HTH domain|nr:helix-turn-helix transcriptional regulator [Thermoanaerobaculia bacterium]
MFANLGRTLSLLRELRGRSQTRVAREARIGKSQLSKYENGKELPKFETLEKILHVLKVDMFEFFYTLYLVDGRAAALAHAASIAGVAGAADAAGVAAGAPAAELSPAGSGLAAASSASSPEGDSGRGPASAAIGAAYLPPLPHQHPLLAEATDQAFARVFSDLLMLYRRVFEQVVLSGSGRPDNAKI